MAETLLPALTGPYAVGNRRLFLTDTGRSDPWTGAANRLVTATAWYPTVDSGPAARYLSQVDASDASMALDVTNVLEGRSCWPGWFGGAPSCIGVSLGDTMYPRIRARDTRAVLDAAVRTDLGLLPTIVYSPGLTIPGNMGSVVAQELASHGYLVITLSHTYESVVTETANGVLKQNAMATNQITKCLTARIGDVRYILDQLPTLPHGLGAAHDPDRIALAGHSAGGLTGLEVAYLEPDRVKAVAVLDSRAGYTGHTNAQSNGLGQPVMLLSGPVIDDNEMTGAEDPGWDVYQQQPHGPLHMLQVAGTKHHAFSDVGLVSTLTAQALGTITAARAMALHPRWTRAFLDTYLLGTPDPLMAGPSPDWPEVTAV
ncbi:MULTISPECIES: hypothetical protein [unclassified Nocardia]|uniref:alpha/beta hydrolase family protein n=1 Tax=unclassified Nocardia TaxID=2637762 RepID=UPI00278C59BA|nr:MULTISPECIES: hypothetical protein [unclassified Nocardia]